MSKIDILKTAFDAGLKELDKWAPSILHGIGITGGVVAGVKAAAIDTPKALKAKEERQRELGLNYLPLKDRALIDAKFYWKTITIAGVSILLLFMANKEHLRREAVLIAAYELKDGKLTEYKDAVLKTVGEKKEEEIRATQAQTAVTQNPPPQQVIITDDKLWIYDKPNGRYFQGTRQEVDRAVNRVNKMIVQEGRASINDFYEELKWDYVGDGDRKGWDIQKYQDFLELDISYAAGPNGQPCMVIDYDWEYLPGYWD